MSEPFLTVFLLHHDQRVFRFIRLEQDARRQCFQSITPISNFPYADHLMLAQTTRTAFYPINTVIKKSDTLSDYTYFVVRGIIEIFRVIELKECEEYHRSGFTTDKLSYICSSKLGKVE